MSEWQPIETIPKDGTRVLVMIRYDMETGPVIGCYCVPRYGARVPCVSTGSNQYCLKLCTHWMPLPNAPPEPIKPQPANPNTAYHRIPAPGQRVKVLSGICKGKLGEVGVVEFRQKVRPQVVVFSDELGTGFIDAETVLPIGDNPRFILVPSEEVHPQ